MIIIDNVCCDGNNGPPQGALNLVTGVEPAGLDRYHSLKAAWWLRLQRGNPGSGAIWLRFEAGEAGAVRTALIEGLFTPYAQETWARVSVLDLGREVGLW